MSESTFNPNIIEMDRADIVALRDTSLTVVESVDWAVQPGEFWVVAGQQRSGKSDLLQHAGGLMAPGQGVCRVFGCDVRNFNESHLVERQRVGFVFADGRLFNQLTVAENVALPLRYHRDLSDAEAARAVELLLELLELAPFASNTPINLAANWRHRTALARALVLKPELLLLDNPLAGLGARPRQWMLGFLDHLWRGHEFFGGRPMTIVVTTDDLRPWQHLKRKFAVLHEGAFTALGGWQGEAFSHNLIVKDLLSAFGETKI